METRALRRLGLLALAWPLVLSACGGAVDDPPVISVYRGDVRFGVAASADGGLTNVAQGRFEVGVPGNCSTEFVGGCYLEFCRDVPLSDRLVYPSAGTITISGGAVSPASLEFSAALDPPAYMSSAVNSPTPLLLGGELLSMKAQGAGVPPFTSSIRAPVSPTLTGWPVPEAGVPIDIDASKDLVLSLQGLSKHDHVALAFSASNGAGRTATLTCLSSEDDSSVTVSASAMATLRTVSGLVQFSPSVESWTVEVAGDFAVFVHVVNVLRRPDGSLLAGSLVALR